MDSSCNMISPGLSIIHSNHLEDLRRVAVQWIKTHPLSPLENELFIVQSNGMAQWLKLALAENDGCGISAALDIKLPGRFLWDAYRHVLGKSQIPKESPYDKVRLIWRLLRLLPDLLEDERFTPLKNFLSDDHDQRKRYQLAEHLADLFDQYQVYRADWLEEWSGGRDRLINSRGEAVDLPEDQRWQAELWRRVQADVSTDRRGTSRSALHRRFLKGAEMLSKRPATLPRRVIVFGICSLPKQALEALHALSKHSQVLLFVHNPCRHFWADIIEDRELLKIERARHIKKAHVPQDLDLLHQHVNPLLAAWGKQGRDYIGLLYGYDEPEEYRDSFAEIDLFSDFTDQDNRGSLLQQVQQAVLDLEPLPESPEKRVPVDVDDKSLVFHLAHSRQREVEILQDQLLSLFEEIPGLKPRDVIVMTPDIESYAAHIDAVFGNLSFRDERYIPFTIADRPERDSVPVLAALDRLLHLPDSRMAVSDIMDLLEVPAFRGRFGLDEADLPNLHRWIEGSGIRWGLSERQRSGFGLPQGLSQNTWIFGLKRMLLGYAVGAGSPFSGIEPYDEVGGLDASLVGPLSMMVEKLEKHCMLLGTPADAETWSMRIRDLMEDFFLPSGSRDRLTKSRMEGVLDQWQKACSEGGLDEELTLPVVRDYFMKQMNDSSMSQRFLAGMVNFCTLMPMRAIPFKVVCLLGMNDGEYPRSRPPLDFDLMGIPGSYRPGDRSRREDDRYLFLEALLSAREKLYISYIGRSVRDNSERMPSVLVGQLRDYLSSGWYGKGDVDLLEHLTLQHPLQPFSRGYFSPERRTGMFTFAREWRDILDGQEAETSCFPMAPVKLDTGIQLNMLIRFLKNPVQSFFNQRLNIFFEQEDVTTVDQEPFELDRLSPFNLGGSLLEEGLAVEPGDRREAVKKAARKLRRTGELPLKGFGEIASMELTAPVFEMLNHHGKLEDMWPDAIGDSEIRLKSSVGSVEVEVEDWLGGLRAGQGGSVSRWEYYHGDIMDPKGGVSRPSVMTGLWVRHLAGCSQGISLVSHLVAPDGIATLSPISREGAEKILRDIVSLWYQGLSTPIPVTAKTALAYLGVVNSGDKKLSPEDLKKKALEAARKTYEGDGFKSGGELGFSTYLERVYPDFESILTVSASSMEEYESMIRESGLGESGDLNDMPTCFELLSETLYKPLFNALREGR